MGYTEDDSMVRVDFFKSTGKWYTTEGIKWTGSCEVDIFTGFAKSLRDALGYRLSEMDAVCLEPYHGEAFPLQIKDGDWLDVRKYK